LLGKGEEDCACFASVRSWDVEVEECGGCGGDFAVIACAVDLVRICGIDRGDQMGILPVTSEDCGAVVA